MLKQGFGPRSLFVVSAVLFAVLAAELALSVRNQSQTFDESAHMYAGYSYWKVHDFGINPEHPPLAKLIATLPLLPMQVTGGRPMHLAIGPPPKTAFRGASLMGGRRLLYSNDADTLLFRSRMTISIFTFALAVLVLLAANEMFGWEVALIALLLFVFEPNVLANGALVTTDMAATAMLFGTVYTFYRYLTRPSFVRLLVCSLFAGLTISVKHSGLLLFPILLVVAIADLLVARTSAETWRSLTRRGLAALGSLLVIAAVSVTILWSCYGFRYAARPNGAAMVPPTPAFLQTLNQPVEQRAIGFCERHHLLPESYLYGLTDVLVLTNEGRPTYLFGEGYPQGRWFYFPSTLVIKSTIGFLLLLALGLAAGSLWKRDQRRQALAMLLPAAVYLAYAMRSKLDIGHRHILPIYPFLIVLAAAGAWTLAQRSRVWTAAVAALILFHAVSSVRAYPAYLAYSNEFWGGPSKTYRTVGDSNVGWTSGLHTMQRYISDRKITQCWFAYYGPVDLSYFHLPCKTMPTFFSTILGNPQAVVPESVQGPIFVSSENISGLGWEPPELNPYWSFKDRTPDAVLDGSILVFNGTYDVPRISAMSHLVIAGNALRGGHPERALPEAQQAEALAPELLMSHEMLSSLYAQNHQPAEAQREYEQALQLYRTTYSEFAKSVSPPQPPAPAIASAAASAPTPTARR